MESLKLRMNRSEEIECNKCSLQGDCTDAHSCKKEAKYIGDGQYTCQECGKVWNDFRQANE